MQRIRNDDLIIYFFKPSRYVAKNSIISAAVVMQPSEFFDYSAKELFHKMGFDDIDEYIISYPNRFEENSEAHVKFDGPYQRSGETLSGLVKTVSKGIYTNIYANFVNLRFVRKTNLINFGMFTTDLFLTPTVEETMSCPSFKEARHKDLWFCYDWGG